jgi:hypothetical protein
MDFDKKLELLNLQQAQAKELYIKCQGAIEFVESLINEEKEKSKKDKK